MSLKYLDMSKINAEEVLLKHSSYFSGYLERGSDLSVIKREVKAAIKEIVEAVVDRCKDTADTTENREHDYILKVKGEINYE